MEIQRNKRLNWAFIVLAVLAVVLRLVSLINGNLFRYGLYRCLLSLACAVLPLLAIVCSRRKTVFLTCVIAYFAVCAVMTYQAYQQVLSYYGYLWREIFLLNIDGIVGMSFIGLLPLLNSIVKGKTKKELGWACFILGTIVTGGAILLAVNHESGSMYWGGFLKYSYYDYYRYNWINDFGKFIDFNLPYCLSYCVLFFAIGAGILRDAPAQIEKPTENEKPAKIENPTAQKSKQTALFFSIFTGVLGVDRFYLGYTALGIFKLLTVGGAGIWALIDFIRIGVDSLRPADGSPWVEETRDENIRSIAANMQTIAERLEKLQAQNVPAEAEKPRTDGENQETHKVSLKK